MNNLVLQGKFCAEEHQVRAIALVRKIGEEIADKYRTEIASIFRERGDFGRYIEIAKELIPEYARHFPNVAEGAVGYAVRMIVPDDERREITRLKRTKQLENMFGGFDSENFKEHCRKASAIRHEKYGTDVNAMIIGRGFVPWTDEERIYAKGLLEIGQSYEEVSLLVNQKFHGGKEFRHKKNVYDMIRYMERRKSN
jgi:hypothetical protein